MESNWAAENLQTIRTLMERSAVYRRALAPIMLGAGAAGTAAATVGLVFRFDSPLVFGELWLGTAVLAVALAFIIARGQSLKDHEPFWSPPTRRVTQALLPPLLAGLCTGGGLLMVSSSDGELFVSLIWALFYGCALHAAGFFMPRGIRLFGWLFIAGSCALFCIIIAEQLQVGIEDSARWAHWVMGFFFGALHLAYGGYLYLTEKGKNAA